VALTAHKQMARMPLSRATVVVSRRAWSVAMRWQVAASFAFIFFVFIICLICSLKFN
jgi:hypothetical protein